MILIRDLRAGEESVLRGLFRGSVHGLAARHYSAEQLDAWAPREYDAQQWCALIQGLRPFVAESGGAIVGYADLQPSGYIDHFFVAGAHGGRGVGAALMAHIQETARQRGIAGLFADVSLSAEAFFTRHGFAVEARKTVVVRGVALRHARMRRPVAAEPV